MVTSYLKSKLNGVFLISSTFFLGYIGLILQFIWLRDVQVVIGNAQVSLVLTLVIYFLGVSLGTQIFSSRSQKRDEVLARLFLSVLGVLIFSFIHIFLSAFSPHIYGVLKNMSSEYVGFLFPVVYSTMLIGLPAVCIGGQLPLLIALCHKIFPTQKDWVRTLVYGGYSLASMVGILMIGFIYPFFLGFEKSLLLHQSMLLVFLFVVNGMIGEKDKLIKEFFSICRLRELGFSNFFLHTRKYLLVIAFLSGCLSFILQLGFIRLLSLVVRNSLFTITAINSVFIVAVSVGAFSVTWLVKKRIIAGEILIFASLFVAAASAVIVFIFASATDWFTGLTFQTSHLVFLGSVIKISLTVFFVPLIITSFIFPTLLITARKRELSTLISSNVLGVIIGLIVGNFLLLPQLGIVKTLWVVSAGYTGIALLLLTKKKKKIASVLVGGALVLTVMLTFFADFLLVPDALLQNFDIRSITHTSSGPLMVLDKKRSASGQDRRLVLNNYYTLGGTSAIKDEQWQTHLPLLLKPQAKDVFYIGMGTGVTAAAAAYYPVEKVVVTELLAEIFPITRVFFTEVEPLYQDSRFHLHQTDGRTFLSREDNEYDVIIGDLFNPWSQGVSDVYSVEHFQTVNARLQPDGLFVQWIPVHEWKREELLLILATMRQVFNQVTLWRGNFSPTHPVIALVGHKNTESIDMSALEAHVSSLSQNGEWSQTIPQLIVPNPIEKEPVSERERVNRLIRLDDTPTAFLLQYYITSFSGRDDFLTEVNTLDKPLFEFMSSQFSSDQFYGISQHLSGNNWASLQDELRETDSVFFDSYLSSLESRQKKFVQAGSVLENLYFQLYQLQAHSNAASDTSLKDDINNKVSNYEEIIVY